MLEIAHIKSQYILILYILSLLCIITNSSMQNKHVHPPSLSLPHLSRLTPARLLDVNPPRCLGFTAPTTQHPRPLGVDLHPDEHMTTYIHTHVQRSSFQLSFSPHNSLLTSLSDHPNPLISIQSLSPAYYGLRTSISSSSFCALI